MSEPDFSLSAWRPVRLNDLIRLGRDEDGGYVLPRRCVEATRVVVGLGIFDDWSFEEAFAVMNPPASVIGVDGTVSQRQFRGRAGEARMRQLIALARFRFSQAVYHQKQARHWMTRAADLVRFFSGPHRSFHSKHLADVESPWETCWEALAKRDEPILREAGPLSIFVKMDIEGSEYRVLEDILADHDRVNGLVVEFHDVDMHWGRFAELMDQASEHYVIAHIHGNNYHPLARGSSTPRALEISFMHRQLLSSSVEASQADYPLAGLDRPCDPKRPDYVIQF